jgi:hypothetical protein
MKLTLTHGRNDPNKDMDDWGYEGPTIFNVKEMHQMYAHRFIVTFKDISSRDEAQRLTGWSKWEEASLEMLRCNDLIEVNEEGKAPQYFGDLLLSEHEPNSEIAAAIRHARRASQALSEAVRSLDRM